MFENIWYTIRRWFTDRQDRQNLLSDFNISAREAFIRGDVPTLLEAKISRGNRAFRHQFSNWLNSGWRIKAMSGRQLSKQEIIFIGEVILNDNVMTLSCIGIRHSRSSLRRR